jgi:hypothetical protein
VTRCPQFVPLQASAATAATAATASPTGDRGGPD